MERENNVLRKPAGTEELEEYGKTTSPTVLISYLTKKRTKKQKSSDVELRENSQGNPSNSSEAPFHKDADQRGGKKKGKIMRRAERPAPIERGKPKGRIYLTHQY